MNRDLAITPAVKAIVAIGFVVVLLALAFGPMTETLTQFNGDKISEWVAAAGIWGPIVVIGLMTTAIVATPIPSAPIALAAGAAYGHTLGTVYIVLGAELGALAAFGLARFLGRDVLRKWFRDRVDAGWLGSQNVLTFTVFVSRLLPFVSFDIVSYAAGLSRLHFWRFGLATLAGIIPASFVLAHFGNEVVSGDTSRAVWAAIGLGALTLTPLVIIGVRDWHRRGSRHD